MSYTPFARHQIFPTPGTQKAIQAKGATKKVFKVELSLQELNRSSGRHLGHFAVTITF